jgi:hypothetical protein
MTTSADVEVFAATRRSLQAVAEHVLSAARYSATGRIGLRPSPGGVATPSFPSPHGARRLAVQGTELVAVDDRGERRAPLTTLRAAAAFAEVEPGAPAAVYEPATPLDLDRPLAVDAGVAARLADWYQLVERALERLCRDLAGEEPTPVQLWPEHFDLATAISAVNYGGSPGDDGHPEPYLYVGPHRPPPPDGGFWNEAFGASRAAPDVSDDHAAVAFFLEGRRRVTP